MAKSYENAGVNLEAGYEVVRRIKQHVASTSRIGTMGNIGAFGGMFDLSALGVGFPKRSWLVVPFRLMPPSTFRSKLSAISSPKPKVPLAGITGLVSVIFPSCTDKSLPTMRFPPF